MIKKLLATVALATFMATSAVADTLSMQYPNGPGKGGTAFWGDTVTKELNAKLEKHGHNIIPRYLPGQRGKKSLKDWAGSYMERGDTLMIAHGGNGEGFLIEDVGGFDYRDYDPVVVMNTNIWVSINSDTDWRNGVVKFPATGGTGFAADIIAVGMMMCGPEVNATVEQFLVCTDERLRFIPGFNSGGERRQAFRKGQLDSTRDTPQSSLMSYGEQYASGQSRVWFAHGIVDGQGSVYGDPNAPEGAQSFPEVYKAEWGVAPSGPVYEAYKTFQGYRDGFQKTIWIAPNSPYKDVIDQAVAEMIADPEAMARLDEKLGAFPWLGGSEVQAHSDYLFSLITKERLETLVVLAKEVFKYKDAYVKTELLK
jgi:hypothetical protein